MVRIIRSLALTAAILTAGVAAITMTPTAAQAGPIGGTTGTKDSVNGNDVAIYAVNLGLELGRELAWLRHTDAS